MFNPKAFNLSSYEKLLRVAGKDGGEQLERELQENQNSGYLPSVYRPPKIPILKSQVRKENHQLYEQNPFNGSFQLVDQYYNE